MMDCLLYFLHSAFEGCFFLILFIFGHEIFYASIFPKLGLEACILPSLSIRLFTYLLFPSLGIG